MIHIMNWNQYENWESKRIDKLSKVSIPNETNLLENKILRHPDGWQIYGVFMRLIIISSRGDRSERGKIDCSLDDLLILLGGEHTAALNSLRILEELGAIKIDNKILQNEAKGDEKPVATGPNRSEPFLGGIYNITDSNRFYSSNSPKKNIYNKLYIQKERYNGNVLLSKQEYEVLGKKFGDKLSNALEILSNYKLTHGKEYASDYGAMLGWVSKKLDSESSNRIHYTHRNKTNMEAALKLINEIQGEDNGYYESYSEAGNES